MSAADDSLMGDLDVEGAASAALEQLRAADQRDRGLFARNYLDAWVPGAGPVTVSDLIPGDLVPMPTGGEATFVAQTDHPLYIGLRMVIWRLPDGRWSHDALDPRQHVGDRLGATSAQREERLRAALLGGE